MRVIPFPILERSGDQSRISYFASLPFHEMRLSSLVHPVGVTPITPIFLCPFLINLSTNLKCDVISYDYSGCGYSTGIPTPEEINRDVYEVAHFCISVLKKDKKNLILFGFSLGTTPTLYLGNHPHYKKIAGIILLSPILSANDIMFQSVKLGEYIEDNEDKMFTTPVQLRQINFGDENSSGKSNQNSDITAFMFSNIKKLPSNDSMENESSLKKKESPTINIRKQENFYKNS